MNTGTILRKYPTELLPRVLPVPETVDQSRLNERGLYVVQGLDMPLAQQLVVASRQPHIGINCENDPGSRFGTIDRVIGWQLKGRLAVPLVSKAGEGALSLTGFGWMGPGEPNQEKGEPHIPGAKITYAMRIYEAGVGQGNAAPFANAIIDTHGEEYGNEGVWLEAWGDNEPALRTYERVGFQEVARIPGMRQGEPIPRVFMTLGDLSLAA